MDSGFAALIGFIVVGVLIFFTLIPLARRLKKEAKGGGNR